MKALHLENFTKKYKDFIAVDNISFDIMQGEFFGFLGPNGAGKTSTIHCITGISQFNDGIISVFGKDVKKDYREARKLIGISPQDFNVDIFATAWQIVWFVAGYYGIPRTERTKRLNELFDLLELQDHRDKQFKALSGGLKRRVLLARAMVHNPKLLILDEPTAGVDVELRHELWKFLQKINKEGVTILLTSHYLEEVEMLCNRIGVINKGKIIEIGSKDEFVKENSTLEKKYLELLKKV